MSRSPLQGSRGLYRDQDAWLSQQETFDLQQRTGPQTASALAITTAGIGIDIVHTTSAALSANTLYLTHIGVPTQLHTLTQFQIGVNVVGAGTPAILAALYRYESVEQAFRLVRNSEAYSLITGTGTLRIALRDDCVLDVGQRYFIGLASATVGCEFGCLRGGTVATAVRQRSIALTVASIASLQAKVNLADTTLTTVAIPFAAYLSLEGSLLV